MIASKPDVGAELVLDLLAFASLFPASQFEIPYYFNNVMCYLPVCSCLKLSFLLRRRGVYLFSSFPFIQVFISGFPILL